MHKIFIKFNQSLVNINSIETIFTEKNSKFHKEGKPNIFAVVIEFDGAFIAEEFLTLEERKARFQELTDLLVIK
jgi:hypothetical protein